MLVAFVTGGSGFVGQHLIQYLCQHGMQVRALARSQAACESVRRAGAEPIQGDLADVEAMQKGMTGCDVVFHLAAKGMTSGSYEEFYATNVVGTEHVLTAVRTAAVPRLVYVSTEAVLAGGDPIVNVDETRPRARRPLGFYGLTKGEAEERVLNANAPSLEVVVVRPRFIWGNGMPSIALLMKQAASGKLSLIGGGRFLTSTCHVTNACEGMLLAAEHGRGGEIYFLTDGVAIELATFVLALLHTQGIVPGVRTVPRFLAWFLATIGEWVWQFFHLKGELVLTREMVCLSGDEVTLNDAKARSELGYTAAVSYAEGLGQMSKLLD